MAPKKRNPARKSKNTRTLDRRKTATVRTKTVERGRTLNTFGRQIRTAGKSSRRQTDGWFAEHRSLSCTSARSRTPNPPYVFTTSVPRAKNYARMNDDRDSYSVSTIFLYFYPIGRACTRSVRTPNWKRPFSFSNIRNAALRRTVVSLLLILLLYAGPKYDFGKSAYAVRDEHIYSNVEPVGEGCLVCVRNENCRFVRFVRTLRTTMVHRQLMNNKSRFQFIAVTTRGKF